MNQATEFMSASQFRRLTAGYCRRWKTRIELLDSGGSARLTTEPRAGRRPTDIAAGNLAMDEALRWGEPQILPLPGGRLGWAVPLMINARLTGALLASVPERRLFPDNTGRPAFDARRAATELRLLAEAENLTNAAILEARRERYTRERSRAEAIHTDKRHPEGNLMAEYLEIEPALMAAVRAGDTPAARGHLNRLLVSILQRAGGRIALVKTFYMELVMTMCRAAAEMGVDAGRLLGANCADLVELSGMTAEEDLARWLARHLDAVLEAMQDATRRDRTSVGIQRSLAFMRVHCTEPIGRTDVARAAGLSLSHFSRAFHAATGQTYAAMLNALRVERSRELLGRSQRDLKLIAVECGFADQSHFTRIFRRVTGETPRAYRSRVRAAPEAEHK